MAAIIVAFGAKGVATALATGDGGFGNPQLVLSDFGTNQGWNTSQHVRLLADINNDGKADIVAFGAKGVATALATGDGGFGNPQLVLSDFGTNQGWNAIQHLRVIY